MLVIVIEAAVLMMLLKAVSDEELGVGLAIGIALGAAIGTGLLATGLVRVMGWAGILVAASIVAVALGLAISALFGVEIKRSFGVGAAFVTIHIGIPFIF